MWAIRELSRINFCCDKNFPLPRLACPCEGMAPAFKSLRKSKQLLLLIAHKLQKLAERPPKKKGGGLTANFCNLWAIRDLNP